MNFGLNLWNKAVCRIHGLVVIEGMTLSGHPWIINEILFVLGNSPSILPRKLVLQEKFRKIQIQLFWTSQNGWNPKAHLSRSHRCLEEIFGSNTKPNQKSVLHTNPWKKWNNFWLFSKYLTELFLGPSTFKDEFWDFDLEKNFCQPRKYKAIKPLNRNELVPVTIFEVGRVFFEVKISKFILEGPLTSKKKLRTASNFKGEKMMRSNSYLYYSFSYSAAGYLKFPRLAAVFFVHNFFFSQHPLTSMTSKMSLPNILKRASKHCISSKE